MILDIATIYLYVLLSYMPSFYDLNMLKFVTIIML
jgi:hypothetical protein